MKKIYTFLTFMMVALTSFALTPEEIGVFKVTIHVDDPSRVKLVDPKSYGKAIEFNENNEAVVEFGDVKDYYSTLTTYTVEAANGFSITSLTNEADENIAEENVKFPTKSVDVVGIKGGYNYETRNYDYTPVLEDGAKVFITTEVRPQKIITIKGEADQIASVTYSYTPAEQIEDGVWTIDATDQERNISVKPAADYFIRKAIAGEDTEIPATNKRDFTISTVDFTGNTEITIVTYPASEVRTASFTVNILSGDDLSLVKLTRKGEYLGVPITEKTQTIMFDPNETDGDLPFSLACDMYGKDFYKVTLDGEKLTDNYGTYYVNPKEGSVLDIDIEYPDVDVPFTFTFTNEGTEGVIKDISVNGEYLEDGSWLEEGFTVKMGSSIYIDLDYNAYDYDTYDVTKCSINGKAFSYSFTVTEESYDIVITASKYVPKTVTFKCALWEKVELSYSGTYFDLTGEETTLELPANCTSLNIKVAGSILNAVIDEETGEDLLSYSTIYGIKDGQVLIIDAEELVRDLTVYIYLEDYEWGQTNFYLSPDVQGLEQRIVLEPGYNKIAFGKKEISDRSFYIRTPDYESPVLYYNDELAVYEYGSYSVNHTIIGDLVKDGDIIKLYAEEKDTHAVNYEIAEGVDIEVKHDHIVTIDNPANHNVLPGTQIHLTAKNDDKGVCFATVKVNDEAIEPDADGVFALQVDGDKNIKVEKNPSAGVDSVIAETPNDGNVYNTQGIMVIKNATEEQVKALPAGLYIFNGKKVIVK